MEYAIRTTQLTKRYKGIAVVDNVDLSVPKGAIYGLIGRNGAGKSTIIRMLSGLTKPSSGKIEILGTSDAKKISKLRLNMGVSTTPCFFGSMSAAENLEYYRILKGYPRKSIVADTIKLVGLEESSNKKYRHFSLGMKQKLALALAVMGDNEIVLLDKPTNGLDPIGMVEFKNIISSINAEKGTTFVIASHMLSELYELASHFALIDDGELLEETSRSSISKICRSCIVLSVDDTSKTSVILENVLDLKEFEIHPNNVINIYDFYGSNSFIVNELVENGIRVESIFTKSTSLGDYFMNIIKGGGKND